jgi:hypothetical protein
VIISALARALHSGHSVDKDATSPTTYQAEIESGSSFEAELVCRVWWSATSSIACLTKLSWSSRVDQLRSVVRPSRVRSVDPVH